MVSSTCTTAIHIHPKVSNVYIRRVHESIAKFYGCREIHAHKWLEVTTTQYNSNAWKPCDARDNDPQHQLTSLQIIRQLLRFHPATQSWYCMLFLHAQCGIGCSAHGLLKVTLCLLQPWVPSCFLFEHFAEISSLFHSPQCWLACFCKESVK
jgi:hypothetical protein